MDIGIRILRNKTTAASTGGFLKRLIDQAPFKLSKVFTGNGKEFTDHFCTTGEHRLTGVSHTFDRICADNRIEQRLMQPKTAQTVDPIKRFDGCIDAILATSRFDPAQTLADNLEHAVEIYNRHIPQKALGHIPPLQAMENWYQKQPDLFKKEVYNPVESDTYVQSHPR